MWQRKQKYVICNGTGNLQSYLLEKPREIPWNKEACEPAPPPYLGSELIVAGLVDDLCEQLQHHIRPTDTDTMTSVFICALLSFLEMHNTGDFL
jgi:hypothetical protein